MQGLANIRATSDPFVQLCDEVPVAGMSSGLPRYHVSELAMELTNSVGLLAA